MSGERQYRVWVQLEKPLPRWYWWAVERGLSWPFTRARWMSDVEDATRREAAARGMTVLIDPVGHTEVRDGRVFILAEAIVTGPDSKATGADGDVVEVVSRPRCPRCGSGDVELMWVAVDSTDFDSWACRACDNRWAGEQG